MRFKKLFLVLLFLHTPSSHAMEFGEIMTLTLAMPLVIKTLSAIYNQHKPETKFSNLVIQAARNNFLPKDIDDIKKYLDKGVNPNCKIGPYEQTILMLAIEHSNKDLLRYLLQKKNVKVNISDNSGRTPLHYAIELQNDPATSVTKHVKKLLNHNADPNKKTIWLDTPFFSAIRHGRTNLVNLLIKYDADINCKYEFGTSLAYALIRQAPPETIEALCKAKATLINIDNNKNSAFHVAINKKCSKEYIQLLIKHLPLKNELRIQQTDTQLQKTIVETLLVLKQLNIEPDCQFCILAHVAALSTFCGFNKKLCGYLFNIDKKNRLIYQKPFIFHIHNQVPNIIKILQIKNNEDKTALDLLNTIQDQQYKEKVKPLIDAHGLQNDLDALNRAILGNNTLNKNNVIPEIFGIKLN